MTTAKESRTLTIDGDLVRLERTVVEREVRTSDFVAEIARIQPVDTGILPAGCVWYARQENAGNRLTSVYAIERPAGPLTVRFKALREGDIEDMRTLTLAWPNTLWFVRSAGDAISDVFPAVTAAPLARSGRDTPICRLLMPNLYDGGNDAVCLGNLVLKDETPLAVRIESLIRQVFESLWNRDLMPSFEGTGIGGLDDWAAQTAADPEVHRRIAFPAHRWRTAGEMMAILLDVDR